MGCSGSAPRGVEAKQVEAKQIELGFGESTTINLGTQRASQAARDEEEDEIKEYDWDAEADDAEEEEQLPPPTAAPKPVVAAAAAPKPMVAAAAAPKPVVAPAAVTAAPKSVPAAAAAASGDDPLASYASTILLLHTSSTRDQIATVTTRKVVTQLEGLGVAFVQLDGMDATHKELRKALWAKADAKPGTYPILHVGPSGFTCKGEEVQELIDCGGLASKLGAAAPTVIGQEGGARRVSAGARASSGGAARFEERLLRGKSGRRASSVLNGIGALLEASTPSETAAHLLFRYYDRDADGKLDRQGLVEMLEEYGFDAEKAQLLFESNRSLLDGTGSGHVTFDAFWAWLNSANRLGQLKALGDSSKFSYLQSAAQMFRGAAGGGGGGGSGGGAADGRIGRTELGELLRSWGEEDVDDALDEMEGYQEGLDRSGAEGGGGAGYISLQSFVKYLSQFEEWRELNHYRASLADGE